MGASLKWVPLPWTPYLENFKLKHQPPLEICWRDSGMSNMAANSHTWLLNTWNAASLNWDVPWSVKYTPDVEDLVWKKECKIALESLFWTHAEIIFCIYLVKIYYKINFAFLNEATKHFKLNICGWHYISIGQSCSKLRSSSPTVLTSGRA